MGQFIIYLKKRFPTFVLVIKIYRGLIKNKNSYLHTSGWGRSLLVNKPLDCEGREIPWMNYPLIEFLKERLQPDMEVFEYGSGYSTLYLSERVSSITSVEYDKFWYDYLVNKLPDNVNLIYQGKSINGDYCNTIKKENKKYSVVIIDGRDRINCIHQSINFLDEDGVLLLDDSHREKYLPAFTFLKKKGFRRIDFSGIKPTHFGSYKTSVFYRDKNCLNI